MSAVLKELAELGIAVRQDDALEQRVPCPQCCRGDRDDALGVNLETGVFHCFRCNWSGRASTGESRAARHERPVPKPAPSGNVLERIWARTQSLRGTLGQTYLEHRRCALPPADSDLRFLPGTDRHAPSLCALVTDAVTAAPMTLHFTPLQPDGRGRRERRLLAGYPKKGGVIRLWPDEAVTHGLAVAEGIESTLAAAHAYRPAWSTIDAGNLAALLLLAGVESITIYADHDDAGMRAARACGRRWHDAGRDVRILRARTPGHDAADEVAA